jgi:hypothetical protein
VPARATSDRAAAIAEKRMRDVVLMPPTVGIRRKIQARSEQETSRRLS